MNSLGLFTLHMWAMKNSVSLFLGLMYPLTPTSRGLFIHLYPLASISAARYSYLAFFLSLAASIFHSLSNVIINSTMMTCCGEHDLSRITRSGLDAVKATSGGSVPPFTLHPSRSAYSRISSGLVFFNVS